MNDASAPKVLELRLRDVVTMLKGVAMMARSLWVLLDSKRLLPAVAALTNAADHVVDLFASTLLVSGHLRERHEPLGPWQQQSHFKLVETLRTAETAPVGLAAARHAELLGGAPEVELGRRTDLPPRRG
jgi:hypothetical protein